MARDQNIYGMDDNSFAESIADEALSVPDSNRYSGNPIDQNARSKSSPATDEVAGQGEARILKREGNDARARAQGN